MSDAANDNKSHWRMPETEAVLALGSLALFAYVTWAVLFNTIPAENEKYAMLMLGALIGIVKDTFGRYFQATKGAQEQRAEQAKVAAALAEKVIPLVDVTNPAPGTATVTTAPDVDISLRSKEQTDGSSNEDAASRPVGGGAWPREWDNGGEPDTHPEANSARAAGYAINPPWAAAG